MKNQSISKTLNLAFYILSFSLFLGISAPQLFTDGMFMDGLLYSAIAHNLAIGYGSLWDLNFSRTFITHFYGHPPLQIWLQAGLFKIFGNSIYIERFYSFFSYLVTGFIMVKLWQNIVGVKYKKTGWLPLLFWVIIPLTTWAVANNILENTLQIFTLSAVLFLFKSRKRALILNSFLAGLFLFLGFMSKGFVAFFPLILPLLFLLFNFDFSFKKFLLSTFIILLTLVLASLNTYIIAPESLHYFNEYIKEQIIVSLKLRSGYHGRFFILNEFFNQLLPPFIIVFLILIFQKLKKQSLIFISEYSKSIFIFTLLVLSGVLPFLLSLKQRGFYIVPILPYLSILASLIVVPLSYEYFTKKSSNLKFTKILNIITYTLLSISILISVLQFGKIGREKDKISDVYSICKQLPPQSILKVKLKLRKDYSLMGYLVRYGYISMENRDKIETPYFLDLKNDKMTDMSYIPIDLKLKRYRLYKKK